MFSIQKGYHVPFQIPPILHCLPTLGHVLLLLSVTLIISTTVEYSALSPPATCLLYLVPAIYEPVLASAKISPPQRLFAGVHNDSGDKGFPVSCQPSADSGLRKRKSTFLAQALAFQKNHSLHKLLASSLGRTYGVENKTVGMGSLQAPQGKGLVLSTGAAPTRALWFWSPCEPRTKLTLNLSLRAAKKLRL